MDGIDYISLDVPAIPADQVNELVAFHNSYYHTQRHSAQWIWQYQTHHAPKAVFTIARNEGRLIATQAMMPIPLRMGPVSILSSKSENTLLLPEYRGKGIMESLYEVAVAECGQKEISLIWGFTEAVKAFRRFGFSVLPAASFYRRIGRNPFVSLRHRLLKPASVKQKVASAAGYVLSLFKNWRAAPTPHVERLPGYRILQHRIDPRDLGRFKARSRQLFPQLISLELDSDYVEWRIRSHPFLKYTEYQVVWNKTLKAYAFVTQFQGTASVSELGAEGEYDATLLLARILEDYGNRCGEFSIMVNPGCPAALGIVAALRVLGFRFSDAWNLVVRDLSNDHRSHLSDLSNWNTSALWTEGYSM